MTSPYLTVQEVATLARCGHGAVRRAISAGALPAFRPGGNKILIRERDVHEWIESRPAKTALNPVRLPRRRDRRSGEEPGSVADLRAIERKVAAS